MSTTRPAVIARSISNEAILYCHRHCEEPQATRQSLEGREVIKGLPRFARNDIRKKAGNLWGGNVDKKYYVYIVTNKGNRVLYTGVTSNLVKRTYEHKGKLVSGFTKRYNLTRVVYYEIFDDIGSAISREKQIKAGSRQKKIDLINGMNSEWRDLGVEL